MVIQLLIDILFILFVLVSATTSDSIFLPSEEGPTDFSLNGKALAFDEPALPLDLTSLPLDKSISLFEDSGSTNLYLSDNNSGFIGDEPFQLADCSSSSDLFPATGKSRLRRLDRCRGSQNSDPTSSDGFPPFGVPSKVINDLEKMLGLPAYEDDSRQNSICRLVTANVLPWGVCSSGNPSDITVANTDYIQPLPGLGGIIMYYVNYCTLGKVFFLAEQSGSSLTS